ncbi:MAG: transglutaminase domain-containing protein, partial [Nitrospirae bacterium]
NFAHLSIALMRAVGIPARIVGGISLKKPWKVPVGKKTSIVQSMGQGGHAWVEVYYPDLGWLPYDPQQTKEFTSTRHIKQTQGLDSEDINDSWRASPYLPEYSDSIEAKFIYDSIALRPTKYAKKPRSYLLSSPFIARATMPERPPVPEKKKPEVPKGKVFEFGNMEFPSLVNIYKVVGDKGVRILDKETAEYVTSRYVYAQAFEVSKPIKVYKVSLAMHKFGGDGTVYIDLVKDRRGRPGFIGQRSLPVFLENIKRRPGYYWVDFSFVEPVELTPGRYWIVLRHSGDVIMNWFYIPGNPYGEPDDTRSTQKGYRWEDILNYDFVFKVTAKR